MPTYRVSIPYYFFQEVEVEGDDDLEAALKALADAPKSMPLLEGHAAECYRTETMEGVKANKITN